ncbi:hypothetical protein NBH00_11580 [Paraconexibacter antarcticus]|uniref:DprA winged helix domain-containing protein n=1 Tax=Paraconexibacter antarcticus TaxID=2949664 RepID=A0ABY5E1V9_9ACTN|nr:hypothetical protein [Paraconexibacter antarcticus]UTI66822.1 hypothetical protein NBH00_11580 [Paraconexibacter antarcticus]
MFSTPREEAAAAATTPPGVPREPGGGDAEERRRVQREAMSAGERSADLVLGALRRATRSLRLNEMAAVTGMPVGQIGTALLALERRGEATFVGGRWALTTPTEDTP